MDLLINKESILYDSESDYYDISICIITYNKKAFISDAINSILRQITTCSYEIIVGDNASTDGTRDILIDYWNKYSDRMTLIFNNHNLGLSTNMFNTMVKAKGKYIIVLYGDDYWIDDKRLQKQYDFLENNANYVGVTAPIEHRYDGEDIGFMESPRKKLWGKEISLDKYLHAKDFPMAGLMFRNDIFSNSLDHFKIMVQASKDIDDTSFCVLILMKGNIFILDEVMGVYRCFRQDAGGNNFNSVNTKYLKCKKLLELKNNLYSLTGKQYDFETFWGLTLASAWNAMIHRSLTVNEFKSLTKLIESPYNQKWIKLLFKGIMGKIKKR